MTWTLGGLNLKGMTCLAVLTTLALLPIAGCGKSEAKFKADQYAGTYEGTWQNEAAGTSGPVTIEITIDDASKTASLTLDFDGNYLGLGDPPPATLTGSYDDKRALVQGNSELFGDYDVTIDADGKIVGLMKNLAGGAIPQLSYTGTLTATRLDADYVVTLPDGNTANSTLRMEKAQ